MTRIKTSELAGAALNWAVAKANSMDPYIKRYADVKKVELVWLDDFNTARFAEDWSQGGPIIERELHNLFKWNQLDPSAPEMWCGVHNRKTESGIYAINVDGPTPLIAAMRCFVASKLGDEVDVPDELVRAEELL